MHTPNHPVRLRQVRSAFTLLEMMLVLAIIAMIGAIALPRLDDAFERQKLRGTLNSLRLEWDSARLEAMRTGQAQVFTCIPETGSYTIKPLVLQSDVSNAGVGATVITGAGAMAETQQNGFLAAADPTENQAQELEDNMIFVSCLVAGDMRAFVVAQESQSMGTGDVNTQTINQAVIFYPDGSTSTAELRVRNARGDVRGLQIRGLTGHTRTVDISNVPSGGEADTSNAGG